MPNQKFQFYNKPSSLETDSKSLSECSTEQMSVAPIIERLKSTPDNPMEVKIIPRRKIRKNKKNRYPMSELESLKESILGFGLQQPLTVIYLENEDMYCIEGGHRRTTVLDSLIQEFGENQFADTDPQYILYQKNIKPFEKGYPCIISARWEGDSEYDALDHDLTLIPDEIIDSEIRLILTNTEIRTNDPTVRAANIARLTQLYERKNHTSGVRRFNINKQIGEDLGITERQVAKYKGLENLQPKLKAEFENKQLTLNTCSALAKLSLEEQNNIVASLEDIPKEQWDASAKQLLSSASNKNIIADTSILQEKRTALEAEKQFSAYLRKSCSSLSNILKLINTLPAESTQSMEDMKVLYSLCENFISTNTFIT